VVLPSLKESKDSSSDLNVKYYFSWVVGFSKVTEHISSECGSGGGRKKKGSSLLFLREIR